VAPAVTVTTAASRSKVGIKPPIVKTEATPITKPSDVISEVKTPDQEAQLYSSVKVVS